MATHPSILAWRILPTEEPGRLQSTGSHRVKHNWSDLAHTHARENLCPWIFHSVMLWGPDSSWDGRGVIIVALQVGTGASSSLTGGFKEPTLSQVLGWDPGLPDPNTWHPRSPETKALERAPGFQLHFKNFWVGTVSHFIKWFFFYELQIVGTWLETPERLTDSHQFIIQLPGFCMLQPPVNWFGDL